MARIRERAGLTTRVIAENRKRKACERLVV